MKNPKPGYEKTLLRLLLSNDPPSDSESTLLTTALHDIGAEINALARAGSIARMVRMDNNQLCRYNRLKSLRKSLKFVLSPIRRLPNEIILNIILLVCSQGNFDGRVWNSLNPEQEPWTLASVSRRWRQTALGAHQLWSSIDLKAWTLDTDADEPTLFNVDACLARSGERPLAIRYSWISDGFVLPRLLLSSERWEFLELYVDHESMELIKGNKGRFPELSELIIQMDSDDADDISEMEDLYPFDAFEVAPKLNKATVHLFADVGDEEPWIEPDELVLPWNQLTSLETDCFDIVDQCQQLCQQLVDCDLQITFLPGMEDYPITLPSLQHLSVQDSYILDALVLPSLNSLHIEYYETHTPALSLVERSGCPLRSIEVSDVARDADIRPLVRGCPDLVHVTLQRTILPNPYLGMDKLSGWRLEWDSEVMILYKRDREGEA